MTLPKAVDSLLVEYKVLPIELTNYKPFGDSSVTLSPASGGGFGGWGVFAI